MSYQVLARKWRPRTFAELVGQAHVLQALVNALDQNRLHHAYLFTGTRGVGKTTIARIFAKCLNCEQGVSSTPCGVCSSCREIDEGRFVDLIEVDAASRTKVEDTRELLDNVQYAPTRGRYKVYLIDEVHMLSSHSFNALLKTLEEPPPHVKFLLATTDPHKLPVTILSRCLQFSLKSMTAERIVGHLENILAQEQITFDQPALWTLARAANGSMRDALSLTDQAIAFGNGTVHEQDVGSMLGTIDQGQVLKMVTALASADAATVLDAVANLADHSPSFEQVLDDMLAFLHRIAIAQMVPAAVSNAQGDREAVLQLAGLMTAEDVQLYYQIGLMGKKDLPLAPEPRSGFEMALLRMLAFRPDGAPVMPVLVTESAPVVEPKPTPETPEVVEPVQLLSDEPTPATTERPLEPWEVVPDSYTPPADEDDSPPWNEDAAPKPEPAPAAVAQVPEVDAQGITLAQLDNNHWIQVYRALKLGGMTGVIGSNCEWVASDGQSLTLRLSDRATTMYNDDHRVRIENALVIHFGHPLSVIIEVGPSQQETPAAWRERKIAERHQQAVEAIHNDENVQRWVQELGATILEETIEPIGDLIE